jgi:UDP-N-acetylglucosamine 2-epimerase (non-hydrolysing)
MRIACVCGARPNFVKLAAVVEAMRPHRELRPFVVHTGQHYDERLSAAMFEDLALPRPDFHLEVGSGSHAMQTAEVMQRFEPVVLEERPDLVLVVGDVNSTVACSLVAAKLGIAVAHVEAGLRSFDRSMPEELNRVVTDALSDLLFVSEPSGMANLRREGVGEEHIFFVGNVMIDTLLRHVVRARSSDVLERLGLRPGEHAVVTLHRPGNVDAPGRLVAVVDLLESLAARLAVVFPMHPRARAQLAAAGLLARLEHRLHLLEPQGYLDFLRLLSTARIVLTDSGGVQEEATVLRIPCLTLRENTERPATVVAGWNRIVGTDPDRVLAEVDTLLAGPVHGGAAPEKWDGRAGERIARVLLQLGPEGVRRLRKRPEVVAAAAGAR